MGCPRHLLAGLALTAASSLVLAPAAFAQGAPAIRWSALAGAGGAASGGTVTLVDSLGGAAPGDSSGAGGTLAAGFLPGALLDADETWCALPDGLLPGSHLFNATSPAGIAVATAGTLGCLRVRRTDATSPHWIAGLEAGRYWELTGTDAAGGAASGFTVSITLPHSGALADPRACRFTGTTWDCASTSSDASTVTRTGVTALSEWAVGDGPLPATLVTFSVE